MSPEITSSPAPLKDQYEREGYVIVHEAVGTALIEEVRRHSEWLLEKNPGVRPEQLHHRRQRRDVVVGHDQRGVGAEDVDGNRDGQRHDDLPSGDIPDHSKRNDQLNDVTPATVCQVPGSVPPAVIPRATPTISGNPGQSAVIEACGRRGKLEFDATYDQ